MSEKPKMSKDAIFREVCLWIGFFLLPCSIGLILNWRVGVLALSVLLIYMGYPKGGGLIAAIIKRIEKHRK